MMRAERIEAMSKALGLYGYLAEHIVDHLEEQGCAIYRRRKHSRRKREPQSVAMTPQLAGQIRRYWKNHQDMTQSQIAAVFNVNPGRVSEAPSYDA